MGFFALALALMPLAACLRPNFLPTATPLPLPTELATTPLPPAARPGGLDMTLASVLSTDGAQGEPCHRLYRFYPDGLALYAPSSCSATAPGNNWPEISRWFHRDDARRPRGDYHSQDGRIWVRIVSYDSIHERVVFEQFQGEICGDQMVLQEPAVVSAFAQPVWEYVRVSPAPSPSEAPGCRVAAFRIIRSSAIAMAGRRAAYHIQTDPGETCFLRYTRPDGSVSQAPGTGSITADEQGICRWEWEVGEQTGRAVVTIRIDQITQDFEIEIR